MKDLKKLFEDRLMMSMRRFEKEADVSRQTVRNILKGKTKPQELTIKKICAFFNVDYKDYM